MPPFRGAIEGAFTRASAVETAAAFSGCQSERGWFGYSVLLATKGSRAIGLGPLGCEAMTAYRLPTGRDLLLCRLRFERKAPPSERDVLTVHDFGGGDRQGGLVSSATSEVLDVGETLSQACLLGESSLGTVVFDSKLRRIELTDWGNDGRLDLAAVVTTRHGRFDEAMLQACESGRAGERLEAHEVVLVFRFDGSQFVPVGRTAEALAWLRLADATD